MHIDPLLTISLVWADVDIHEVVVSVASGKFSGTTSLYIGPGELSDLADRLSGFPSSPEDQRDFVLGKPFDRESEVRGSLYCQDSTGHLCMHITISCAPFNSSG